MYVVLACMCLAVDMPFEETRALMDINFLSAVFLTKLVLPDMTHRHSGKVGVRRSPAAAAAAATDRSRLND